MGVSREGHGPRERPADSSAPARRQDVDQRAVAPDRVAGNITVPDTAPEYKMYPVGAISVSYLIQTTDVKPDSYFHWQGVGLKTGENPCCAHPSKGPAHLWLWLWLWLQHQPDFSFSFRSTLPGRSARISQSRPKENSPTRQPVLHLSMPLLLRANPSALLNLLPGISSASRSHQQALLWASRPPGPRQAAAPAVGAGDGDTTQVFGSSRSSIIDRYWRSLTGGSEGDYFRMRRRFQTKIIRAYVSAFTERR